MSCREPCSQTQVAPTGIGAVVAASNPAGTQCQSSGFCHDDLEGLPYIPAIDLVGVPPGERCLGRLNAPSGIWQHDPSRAAGMDYVGPLADLHYVPGDKATYGHLPILSPEIWDECGDRIPVNVVRQQDVNAVADGDIGLLRRQFCEDGTELIRHDRLEPDSFPTSCPEAFHLLGYTEQEQICGSATHRLKQWRKVDAIKFPGTQINHETQVDLEALGDIRIAAWQKSGDCYVLGSIDLAEATNECNELGAAGDEFDKLLACDGGIKKVVEADNDQVLISCNSHWKKIQRGLMFYPFESPQEFIPYTAGSSSYNFNITLPDFPTSPCEHDDSRIFAEIACWLHCTAHGISDSNFRLEKESVPFAACGGTHSNYTASQAMIDVTEGPSIVVPLIVAGTLNDWWVRGQILGYWK